MGNRIENWFLAFSFLLFTSIIGYHTLIPEARPENWEEVVIFIVVPGIGLVLTIILAFRSKIQGE